MTLGCGVTAYTEEDAIRLIREVALEGAPLPAIEHIHEDFPFDMLDVNHVIPNMGVMVERGVWFPNLGALPHPRTPTNQST